MGDWPTPLSHGPAVRVRHSAAQTVPSSTDFTVAFDTEDYDTDGLHDTATNNSRLTCRTGSGVYLIYSSLVLSGYTGGLGPTFELRLVLTPISTGTPLNIARVRGIFQTAGSAPALSLCTGYRLSAGDYVELKTSQTTGSNNDIQLLGSESPVFGMHLVSTL